MSDPPPETQRNKQTCRTYLWVFLFHYDPDNEFPFSSVLLHHFKGTDFPFEVITGHLGLDDRLKPRNLSRLPGPKYCIFAKAEDGEFIRYWPWFRILIILFYFLGTTSKRRNQEIDRLNNLCQDILPMKSSLQKCYKYMCQTEPYRMLRGWSYDMIADKIPNEEQSTEQPEFTDVCYQSLISAHLM